MAQHETAEAWVLGTAGLFKGLALEGATRVRGVRPAHKMLALLAAEAVVYDLKCKEGETVSEGVHSGMDKRPLVIGSAISILALHFMNVLPKPIDPLHQGLKAIKG
jgi:hypothetical protein